MDDNNKENAGNIIDIAKEAVTNLTEKVIEIKEDLMSEEQSEILGEFKETGLKKIKFVMDEISSSIQVISKSGYDFKKMNASMGIPPSLKTVFHYEKEITEEEKKKLMDEVKDKKIVGIILKCLFKSNEFYHSVNIGSYKIDEVVITLGLTPGVDISFIKK